MNYKKMIFLVSAMTLITTSVSYAIPSLQLDIKNGYYYTPTATILSSSQQFKLYAYLIPDANATLDDTYYISAAVTPQVGPAYADLGSFSINGDAINVTSGMVYGDPPIETYTSQLKDPGDLSPHGIFNTYFKQIAFTFNPANKAIAYNTQDTTGVGPTQNSSGTMYYQSFDIDTRFLPGY
jgi:hypothetical protein